MRMLGTSGANMSAFTTARSRMCNDTAFAISVLCIDNMHDVALRQCCYRIFRS